MDNIRASKKKRVLAANEWPLYIKDTHSIIILLRRHVFPVTVSNLLDIHSSLTVLLVINGLTRHTNGLLTYLRE